VFDNIFSSFFPVGTRRRQFLKSVLIKDSENPSPVEEFILRKAATPVCKKITTREQNELDALKNCFKGKRCFIIGNGPSLNKCDLSSLQDEFTFGVNGIFYKTDESGFTPSFYMVEDGHVIDDNLDRINSYEAKFKFFPSIYKNKIEKRDNTFFFTMDLGFYRKNNRSYGIPRFSENFDTVAYAGQSVTYLNLQLAYYLGFDTVYLVGMDFHYDIPESAIINGLSIESMDDDPNHFHPEYFGKGKKWHDPKLDSVAMNYEFAKIKYEQSGRRIFNATYGGNLEIFERVDFDSLMEKAVT